MKTSPILASRAAVAALAATIAVLALTGAAAAAWKVGGTTKPAPRAAVAVGGTNTPASRTAVAVRPVIRQACDLVTAADASTLFGADAGVAHTVWGTCVFDDGSHELIVAYAQHDGVSQFAAGQGPGLQPVAGLGDRAYFRNGRLAVLKGASAVLITLVPSPASSVSPAVVALAKAATARM
jgi:hypothetical protein